MSMASNAKKIVHQEATERAITIIELLREQTKTMNPPMIFLISQRYGKDPFLILISCLLSLRTRDTITWPVSQQLFEHVTTPEALVAMPIHTLERIIKPIGFYRKKAHTLHEVSLDILHRFKGKVPHTEAELLSIKGVGRKTANLVLGEGFGIPSICVDTHVHRISNRLGLIKTKTPEQTEYALKQILPQQYWIEYNRLIVVWGQNICVPISPRCSACVLFPVCERRGVKQSR